MTDSVWWYVLAGFLLGFILSTLWEWLYFRRRRMRIENQRIAELEATVRSLSTISQSAETNTSSGFAAGYQSPMVFLEGEEDDVDTVEVIVPAPPEPVDFDQAVAPQTVPVEQSRTETQFSPQDRRLGAAPRLATATECPVRHLANQLGPSRSQSPQFASNRQRTRAIDIIPSSPGCGCRCDCCNMDTGQRSASGSLRAGTACTAASTAECLRQKPVRMLRDIPVAEPLVSETPVSETIVYSVPAEQAAEEQITQEQSSQDHIPGLVGDLAPSKQTNYVSSTVQENPNKSIKEPARLRRLQLPRWRVQTPSPTEKLCRRKKP